MISRSVAIGMLAALLLSAGSCRDGDDDGPSSTSTSGRSTSSTTTDGTSTTLSADDQLRRQVVELFDLRNEVFMNPDPTRVDEFLDSRCECYGQDKAVLTDLQSKGWRYAQPHVEVVGVRLENDDVEGFALFSIAAQASAIAILDRDGKEVGQVPARTRSGYHVGLVKVDGWHIQTLESLDLDSADLSRLANEGVP